MADAVVSENVSIERSTGEVYLENIQVGGLKVKTSTGNNTVLHATCGDVQLQATNGTTQLTDMTCANLTSVAGTGNLMMKNVVASGNFTIERGTGDVTFDGCDAAELFVETSTGDVVGSLLTEKVFIPHTNTGSVHVPETITGGKCKITTSTGDIEIRIAGN
jgi:DUF4097 and DUF4098 domain-containing protein YvlB